MAKNTKRIYIDFDPSKGFPAGKSLYYECLRCGELIPSIPDNFASCECGNLRIDGDAGRVSASDESKLRLVKVQRS